MSNISITTYCNRNCSYCFAGEILTGKKEALYMSEEIFDRALQYLADSGISQVRLLGGEPTQHPDIIKMSEKALIKGFSLLLFSNGLMPQKVLDFFKAIPDNKMTILLNTIHPIEKIPSIEKKQLVVMKELCCKIMLGINIFSRRQTYNHLLDYIDNYNLIREIRLGIAQPLLEKSNDYLHPKFYKEIGNKIIDLLILASKRNIKLGFDCGFVPCMFDANSYDMLGDIFKKTGNHCNPIIDLSPDGKFFSCYPLKDVKTIAMRNGINASKLISEFNDSLNPYSKFGIYSHCSECEFFLNNYCSGGCKSMKIKRLNC